MILSTPACSGVVVVLSTFEQMTMMPKRHHHKSGESFEGPERFGPSFSFGGTMRLTELNPRWIGSGGECVSDKDGNPVPERHGVAVVFDCPCGRGDQVCIEFNNPIDGLGPHDPSRNLWSRTGDAFETLTLTPSIQRAEPDGCRWHGFITNGEIITC